MRAEVDRRIGTIYRLLFAICLVLVFSLGLLYHYSSGTMVSETEISVTVTYGYHNYGKGGRNLPVYFHLENNEAASFEGRLQILVGQNEDEYLLYEKAIALTAFERRTEFLTINLPAGVDQIYIKVLDQAGEAFLGYPIAIRMNMDVSELFLGILTDNPENLSYFNNQQVGDDGLITKAFYWDSNDFPENNEELQLLDVVIISDFDTSTLSEQQIEGLSSWISDGGTLLLGIGEQPERVLSGFPVGMVDASVGDAEIIKTDLGVAHFAVIEEDNYVTIPYREVSFDYGNPVFSSVGRNLMTKMLVDNGTIAVAGFDFTDISAYCNENNSYVSNLFTKLISKERLREISQEAIFGNYSKYWNIKNTVSTGDTKKLPNPYRYMMLLTLYLLIVGPGMYFLMRRIDKRRFYSFAIIIMALLFSLIIYLLGVSSRFTKSFFIYASIQEFEEEYVNEISYLNLMAPTNDVYSITIDQSYSITPVPKESFYFSNSAITLTGTEEYSTLISHSDNATTITVRNTPTFQSKLFQLERKSDCQEYGGVYYQISYFNGEMNGFIENQLGYDLEKAAIVMYGEVIILGDIQDGERVVLSGQQSHLFPPGYSYEIARGISGNIEFDTPDIKNLEYIKSSERTALLQHYISNSFTEASMKARFLAFTTERNQDQMTIDKDYDAYGQTLVSFAVDIDYTKDDMVYYPRLIESPKVIMGNYLEGSNTIYGNEPVILEYQLGRNLDIDSIAFSYPDLASDYSYFTPFTGQVYFYNNETQRYDLKPMVRETFYKTELIPYLSTGNVVRIKYEMVEEAEYRWDITLPVISVIGRDNHAEN